MDTIINDERAELFENISDHLSELSQASQAPEGSAVSGSAFGVEDFTFDEVASWLPRLQEVEVWLNLDASIDDSSPISAIESLSGLLIDEPTADDLQNLELSDELLRALEKRLSTAVNLCQEFTDRVETQGVSISAASEQWSSSWDTESSGVQSSGPVKAQSDTININDIVAMIEKGKLELNPSFQRGDVWSTKDAQKLVASVLRGIPLPSIILLQPDGERITQVVDGKQRITSILRFIGKHPDAVARVEAADKEHPGKNLKSLFESDYPKFRRAWKSATGDPLNMTQSREYKFPFPLPRGKDSGLTAGLEILEGKYFTEIADIELPDAQGFPREISDIFDRSNDYKVLVIKYMNASQRLIHEVFGLYNRQGKQLNAEEIRNAVFHHLELARGLLVVAGDNRDVSNVAPFLDPVWAELESVAETLESYGFGTDRYKRSKVLSWLVAHLVLDSTKSDGTDRLQSTAGLITDMYNQVAGVEPYDQQISRPHPLEGSTKVKQLLQLIAAAIENHAAFDDAWDPGWLNKSGKAGWQELQLVGSLLGVTIAAVHHGENLPNVLSTKLGDLRKLSASKEFERDPKTQTGNQWKMIAKWSIGIAELLEADLNACDAKVRADFGGSGIAVLGRLAGS